MDDLRKVIKFNKTDKPEEKKTEKTKKDNEKTDDVLEREDREALEQKRAILQNIKDFDFQIKKNVEDITILNQKLDSISKDLNDLVSLYEIVSEQMNPFVGLSKVTKKRIDALENFTKEIEELKIRLDNLELSVETTDANLEEIIVKRGSDTEEKIKSIETYKELKEELSSGDVNSIIEKALNALSVDNQIDIAIDKFLENLKDMNIN